MAYEAVSHLLIRCSEWLGTELLNAYDVNEKVQSIKEKLEWMHAFLQDAHKISYCESSERAKLWVRQIVDIAHDAEDAIDIFTCVAAQSRRWSISKLVRDPRRRVARKIDKIIKAMNETIINRSLFGIENLPVGGGNASTAREVEEEEQVTSVVAEEGDVVGMDDDASLLVEKLMQGGAEGRGLVSIVESMSPIKARRLVKQHDGSGTCPNIMPTHFRSLLLFSNISIEKDVWKSICGFKLLRVLHLDSVSISSNSLDGIESLILLKYLGLMRTRTGFIPSTISNLHHLQTLDVRNNINFQLPDDIWKFEQLRHVRTENSVHPRYGWGGRILIPNHVELGQFVKLQTLTGVRAGDWMKTGMAGLVNVRKLAIDGVTEEYDPLFSTFKLPCLRSLKLSTKDGCPIPSLSAFSNNSHLYAMYLDGPLEDLTGLHQFPAVLSKLNLRHSGLQQDSMATLEMLPNLRVLYLDKGSYVEKEMIITAEGFQRLQVLTLNLVTEIEELIVEEGAMPGLTHLTIEDCENLREVPQGLRSRTGIQKLVFNRPI
ncbi:hypothetical protein MRB53_023118 [Persea americana]|uniref:Uncharacterized protein n=1 Tax=Persea americana TaxID=3435 RepID=A0ACC2L952_PERAE|nr:hypothetical protein MRB53_023118 [Persea americana]